MLGVSGFWLIYVRKIVNKSVGECLETVIDCGICDRRTNAERLYIEFTALFFLSGSIVFIPF